MLYLDSNVSDQLSTIRDKMKSLQNFWVKGGAIQDEDDVYTVRANEEFSITYDPNDGSLSIFEYQRGQNSTLVMKHKPEGLAYFGYHMDEVHGITNAIRAGYCVLDSINDKAMKLSTEYAFQCKVSEFSQNVMSVTSNLMQKARMGMSNLEIADLFHAPVVLSSKTNGDNGNGVVCLKVDLGNEISSYCKVSPNGNLDVLAQVNINGRFNFNEELVVSDKDKALVLNVCLNDSKTILSELKESSMIKVDNGKVQVIKKSNESGPSLSR